MILLGFPVGACPRVAPIYHTVREASLALAVLVTATRAARDEDGVAEASILAL